VIVGAASGGIGGAGFFTLLAYARYPMKMSSLDLGWVFFGWGILVAVSSVWVAPVAQRTIATRPSLVVIMVALTAVLVVMAIGVDSPATLAACVIVSGFRRLLHRPLFATASTAARQLARACRKARSSRIVSNLPLDPIRRARLTPQR
jgi:ACDE family multidrug resistance protein